MNRNPLRVRSKVAKARLDELSAEDRLLLEVGPSPRTVRRVDWPATEVRLRVLWPQHRAALLAVSPPALRPWAFWRFDAPPAASRPGTVQDALVADGTMSNLEAALMAASRSRRPGAY